MTDYFGEEATTLAQRIDDVFAQGWEDTRTRRDYVRVMIRSALAKAADFREAAPALPGTTELASLGHQPRDADWWRWFAAYLTGLPAPAKNVQAGVANLTAAIHMHLAREAVRPALTALDAFKQGPGPTAPQMWNTLAETLDNAIIADFPKGMTEDQILKLSTATDSFIDIIRECFGPDNRRIAEKDNDNRGEASEGHPYLSAVPDNGGCVRCGEGIWHDNHKIPKGVPAYEIPFALIDDLFNQLTLRCPLYHVTWGWPDGDRSIAEFKWWPPKPGPNPAHISRIIYRGGPLPNASDLVWDLMKTHPELFAGPEDRRPS